MHYDDNWGQLHIHLEPGEQRLKGDQVVGYMRFRHDNEGDFGRIRRQQQVIQTLSQRVKDPRVVMKASGLIDAIRQYIQTDLSPSQQLALAHLFHKIEPANVQTAALPSAQTETIDGISYVIPDEYKKEAVVEWLVNGNPEAMNRLITVRLKNASGSRELYNQVSECLRRYGFDVVRAGRVSGEPIPATRAVQHTSLRGAARRVLETLGLGGNVEKEEGPSADVTLYVGKDLETNPVVAASDSWPEAPERPAQTSTRGDRRSRRSRQSALVRVRAYQETEAEEQPAEAPAEPAEPSLDVPGTADSSPAPERGGADTPDEPAKPAEPPSGGDAPAGDAPGAPPQADSDGESEESGGGG